MPESFAELLKDSEQQQNVKINSILTGTVVDINREKVIINVGLKSEGFVNISQFKNQKGELEIAKGDEVEIALDSIDNGLGHTLLSREKAKHIKLWQQLAVAMNSKEVVTGTVISAVKGGLIVNIGVVKAFLPGSLIDVVTVKNFNHLIGQDIEAIVIKMDEVRNNVVISRKEVIQKSSMVDRDKLLETLEEGKEIEGIVKNIAAYGAFVDIGGVDGLLYITDISWERIGHPSEKLSIGDVITVKVLSYDKEKTRISLGLKQLSKSPWSNIKERFPVGKRVSGAVSNLTDYGAFVRIEDSVEGLVHVSEMDWTNNNVRPSKVVKLNQKVDVVILDIQEDKHRISLSIKQTLENPWEVFAKEHNKGDEINVKIKSITDFGLFVGLPNGINGLIHLTDTSWEKQTVNNIIANYIKGQELKVMLLNIDVKKERVSLGIKQLTKDHFSFYINKNKKGAIVKGVVKEIDTQGAVITLAEEVTGYLKINEISQEHIEDINSVLTKDQEVELAVIKIDKNLRSISLSIKAKDLTEEKNAVKDYRRVSEDNNPNSKIGSLLLGASKDKEKEKDEDQ